VRRNRKRVTVLLASAMMALLLAPSAWTQSNFKTLYRVTGGRDGALPWGSLIFDQAGNIYGTTAGGGGAIYGTVFRLTRNANGTWANHVLHRFNLNDGAEPLAGLTLDAAGNLYGTTYYGGAYGDGVVFQLTPHADGSWKQKVLHSFRGVDGNQTSAGLILDAAGSLYGSTYSGGAYGAGAVFKMTRNANGRWKEMSLHSFTGGRDGANPYARLIFDQAGNLYGTTAGGNNSAGDVFELEPKPDGSWKLSVLHAFKGGEDGSTPWTDLIFDPTGNLYGTTKYGGDYGYGTVFQLTPKADGSWNEKVLHSFAGKDGRAPTAGVILDAAGSLYGTTNLGGDFSKCLFLGSGVGCGVVFKLAPTSNGEWQETVLHRFHEHPGDLPYAGLIPDAAGNLYGTTSGDLLTTFGSVFEIMP
jgi:uncharacterized repeat protein (TIGR03803 family)